MAAMAASCMPSKLCWYEAGKEGLGRQAEEVPEVASSSCQCRSVPGAH